MAKKSLVLLLLSKRARVLRLAAQNKLTFEEAWDLAHRAETADQYTARNARALDELRGFMRSTDYLGYLDAINNELDPTKRELLLAHFDLRIHEALDMEAIARAFGAAKRRSAQEGLDAPGDEWLFGTES